MIGYFKGETSKILSLCLCVGTLGCTVIFPDRSAPKSGNYIITPLQSPWQNIPVGQDPNSIDALKADIAFENAQTGAIISLNSICRKYQKLSLSQMSDNLVLGIKAKKILKTTDLSLSGVSAKKQTVSGIVDGENVVIQTVVLKHKFCTYDFIFVALPQFIQKNEQDFDSFLASFKVEN